MVRIYGFSDRKALRKMTFGGFACNGKEEVVLLFSDCSDVMVRYYIIRDDKDNLFLLFSNCSDWDGT